MKINKRVPRLKSEIKLRSNIAYNHAVNIQKIEKKQVNRSLATVSIFFLRN